MGKKRTNGISLEEAVACCGFRPANDPRPELITIRKALEAAFSGSPVACMPMG
tara:strand:+ start:668 stop:826 length:159 start_codon:yes stop_codon:yes gene_type:complete